MIIENKYKIGQEVKFIAPDKKYDTPRIHDGVIVAFRLKEHSPNYEGSAPEPLLYSIRTSERLFNEISESQIGEGTPGFIKLQNTEFINELNNLIIHHTEWINYLTELSKLTKDYLDKIYFNKREINPDYHSIDRKIEEYVQHNH